VYVPDPAVVHLIIVLEPEVVTVGEPVTVPEYDPVGTDRITTPEPPEPPPFIAFGAEAF
jgi:hypothetical protein